MKLKEFYSCFKLKKNIGVNFYRKALLYKKNAFPLNQKSFKKRFIGKKLHFKKINGHQLLFSNKKLVIIFEKRFL